MFPGPVIIQPPRASLKLQEKSKSGEKKKKRIMFPSLEVYRIFSLSSLFLTFTPVPEPGSAFTHCAWCSPSIWKFMSFISRNLTKFFLENCIHHYLCALFLEFQVFGSYISMVFCIPFLCLSPSTAFSFLIL